MDDIVPSLHVSSVLIKCTISTRLRLGYEDKKVVVQDYWNSTILGTISGLALYSGLGTENNNGFKL